MSTSHKVLHKGNLTEHTGENVPEVLRSIYFEAACEITIRDTTVCVWVHRMDMEQWRAGTITLDDGRSLTDVIKEFIEGALSNGHEEQIDRRSNARHGRRRS